MTRMHPMVLALALSSGLYAQSATAAVADLVRGSATYDASATDNLFLGLAPWGGTLWVMAYDARNPNNCDAYFLVTPNEGAHAWGLETDVTIELLGGNDLFTVAGEWTTGISIGGPGAQYCPNLGVMSPLNQNGRWLTVRGGDGHDTLRVGAGSTGAQGGAGDDILVTGGPGLNSLSGDTGEDILFNSGSSALFLGGADRDATISFFGTHDEHRGGSGSDCVGDDQAVVFDCGSDLDYLL